jgi:hypothetical protein
MQNSNVSTAVEDVYTPYGEIKPFSLVHHMNLNKEMTWLDVYQILLFDNFLLVADYLLGIPR